MSGAVQRDLTEVRAPIAAWLIAHLSARNIDATGLEVALERHTGGGYSNEIIFVTATGIAGGDRHDDRLVLRLPPPGPGLFPDYDLAMQVAVQRAVADNGVPIAGPVVLETDETWLGAPFLVMPRVDGHDPGEAPAVDAWVTGATFDEQRAMHERFLEVLARIHTTPWEGRPVATHLRGATGTLADEVRFWADLVTWTFDGAPPTALVDLYDWCRLHLPTAEPPASVLWGDVRMGNVVFDDRFVPIAVLDWEMSSIGPAELDLAWHTALETMAAHFVGTRVPGFLAPDEVVERHARALGRPLVDYAWFEVFALARSASLSARAHRLRAIGRGERPRPAGDDAVLAYAVAAIDALS